MPAHYPVPIQEDVRDLLHDLLGRGVAVDKAGLLELEEDEAGAAATYLTEDGGVGGLVLVDGGFVCRVGAALSMVPGVVAEESMKRNEMPDNLLDNAREVLNVFARSLNSASTPHLRLDDLHTLPGDLPEEVAKVLAAPEYRRDFVAQIEGYGKARMAVMVM